MPCHTEMEFLSQRGIPFEARNIRENPAWVRELIEMGSRSTPTTVIDGDVVIGFDPYRISELLGL